MKKPLKNSMCPPRLAEWLMKHLAWPEDREAIVDNLKEEYENRVLEQGKWSARLWFRLHVLRSVVPFISFEWKWSLAMIKNDLKIALRILRKQKIFSVINTAGLVVGFTCFLLIFLYVRYEKSFDTFHENSERIFRVATQDPGNTAKDLDTWATSNAALAPSLMENYPEVEVATRFSRKSSLLLSKGDKSFNETGIFADEYFFDVFSFKLMEGHKDKILDDPLSIVISLHVAEKFFGKTKPIGQTLNCPFGDLKVTGVMEKIQEKSHIQCDWLISFKQVKDRILNGQSRNPRFFWAGALSYFTYCVLRNESDKEIVEQKITALENKKYEDFGWDRMRYKFHLQPLTSIHLHSHLNSEFSANNSNKLILLFSAVAVFVLFIACINSMNLTSTQAAKRMKEIGIRKIVGGRRGQIFRQFTVESFLLILLSLLLSLGIARFLLPGFSRFFERTILFSAVFDGPILLGLAAVFIVSGILTGFYPAVVLSSCNAVKTLKGKAGMFQKGAGMRNVLVVLQFSITVALMISSVAMMHQIRYIHEKPIGYDREHVVVTQMTDSAGNQGYEAFRNAVLQNTHVIDVTTSENLPTQISNTWAGGSFLSDDGVMVEFPTELLWTDFNFLDFYRMDLLKGRTFSEAHGTDPSNAVILNETFIKKAGWKNPVGKRIKLMGNMEREVVGVVKDFHFQSMYQTIKPIILFCRPVNRYIQIRIKSEQIPKTIEYLQKTYRRLTGGQPFDYFFLDDNFNRMYTSEQKMGKILVSFAILAIFIACLGIFGLASNTAERRTKEIGIRKALGASSSEIFILITRIFTKWVVIANLIAWPVAYIAVSKWLQNFAYRIHLTIWPFIFSGLTALLIAFFTASFQTVKAAAADPVDSLRYE
ncbi:MAG: ABC transporter permease [Candidatus Aminicenantes bacterium]|nr:ABC transporter permease [Candidatus Aminicenantes bacterium]